MTSLNELFSDGFSHPLLKDWMNGVAGKDPECFVALPLIQRGAVWKPSQIITLWDSLLRGMPIGSLMVSELKPDAHGKPVRVRSVGSNESMLVPQNGGIALIDGQQRTFAVLLGWLQGDETSKLLGRQIWVDFADKPARENMFRLHVTTSAQRHGFTKADSNTRLSLSDRRAARAVLGEKEVPWASHLPLPLAWLIHEFQRSPSNPASWKQVVLNELQQESKKHRGKGFADFSADECEQAVSRFAECLERLFKLRIPLIKIPDACFRDEGKADGDDPALAILFKRIGTGGTNLSDADYAYSVIKHHLPQSFELVEQISKIPGLPRLFGPVDIVMTAVRLVAAQKGLPDYESPTKADFDRLRRDAATFLQEDGDFLTMVQSHRLENALKAINHALLYRGGDDIGLPMEGLVLVSRPMLQVMLRWLVGQPLLEGDALKERAEKSRVELIRFVLYTNLAMPDQKRASKWAFEWLKKRQPEIEEQFGNQFPGKELVHALIEQGTSENKDVAWSLPSVGEFEKFALSAVPVPGNIRGGERFEWGEQNPSSGLKVFRRWWGQSGHHHPLLLWLQRSYVQSLSGNPEEVRYDDETLYDYDHLLPYNHCGNWTGNRSTDSLLKFLAAKDNGGHWRVGNSIGNLRVWYASDNRSDGDKTTVDKLTPKDGVDGSGLVADSAITAAQWKRRDWHACSDVGHSTSWNATRASAFQLAVEQRTLDLYTQYFEGLDFQSWFPR